MRVGLINIVVSSSSYGGLTLGSPALTSRGFQPSDMTVVCSSKWIIMMIMMIMMMHISTYHNLILAFLGGLSLSKVAELLHRTVEIGVGIQEKMPLDSRKKVDFDRALESILDEGDIEDTQDDGITDGKSEDWCLIRRLKSDVVRLASSFPMPGVPSFQPQDETKEG